MVQLNKAGLVADYQAVSQFEPNETQFACGYYAAALNKFAGPPDKGPTGSAEQVDQQADAWYTAEYGGADISKLDGISIDQLHTYIKAGGNHYFDIVSIGPNSDRAHDAQEIRAAVKAGYPVIATITEVSVFDFGLNGNPYAWGPSGTHVVTIAGIDPNGNYKVIDPANISGQLNGQNTVRPWPRVYDAGRLDCPFACVLELPWLSAIPSGDPLSWPADFNGQNITPPVDHVLIAAVDCWNSVAIQKIPLGTGIFNAWLDAYRKGTFFGPPLCNEYKTYDWNGKPIIVQEFPRARCEWVDNTPHWYS